MEERERSSMKPSCTGSDSKDAAPATTSSTPPASRREPDTYRGRGEDVGDQLDICSDHFDPLLALYSPVVPVPFPNIKCFDNVASYESFLKGGRGRAKPENVEKKQRKAMKGVADPERIERLKQLMVRNPLPVPDSEEEGTSGTTRRRKQRAPKNVLTRMSNFKGPLGALHRCVEEKIRVKVHIRTFKGLRGVCSGFVVAFDKFWNMAMVDVDETYREPLLGQALYHEKALTISRLFEKLKVQESREGDGQAKKHRAKGKTSFPPPATAKIPPTSLSAHPAPTSKDGDGKRGDSKTEARLLKDAVRVRRDKRAAPPKAPGPQTGQELQKKNSQPYGKVHTRHINQLFVRGENVLLVNLQPV
ncbi:U7 snRNA-associated Sm-like protein LSm11 [Diretmus argenteus]